jgi:hypothetical protein
LSVIVRSFIPGQRRDRQMFAALEDQLGVDLVAQHDDVPAPGDLGDLAYPVRRRHRAGRVVGRHQHQGAGAGRDPLLDLLGHQREIVALPGRDGDRHAAAHLDRRVVGGEARARHQHLVARIDQGEHAQHHGFLRAGRDDDLLGPVIQTEIAAQVAGDRAAQLGQAGGQRVMVLVLVDRLLRGLRDMARRVEIGIAAPHRDDIVELRGALQQSRAIGDVLVLDPRGQRAHQHRLRRIHLHPPVGLNPSSSSALAPPSSVDRFIPA